jgi:hypothetical protein
MFVSKFNAPIALHPVQSPFTAQAAEQTPAAEPPKKKSILPSIDPNDYGIHGQWIEKLKAVGNDVNKLPWWEKALAVSSGAFAGWKLDEYAHAVAQRSAGNDFKDDGRDQYLKLKGSPEDLLAATSKKHTFVENVKDGDFTGSSWKTFQRYIVLTETGSTPTYGTYNGKPNMPVVMIALAQNPSSDKDAVNALAKWLRNELATSPAERELYQPVIDALKTVHNTSL